jgi:hypothetical protein
MWVIGLDHEAASNFADPKNRRIDLWPTRRLKKSYY